MLKRKILCMLTVIAMITSLMGGFTIASATEETAPWTIYHVKMHSTQTASGTIDFSTAVVAEYTNTDSIFTVNPNTFLNRVNLLEQEDGRFILGVGKDTDGWNAEGNYPTSGTMQGTHGAMAVGFSAPHAGTYELIWKLEYLSHGENYPNRTYIGKLNDSSLNFTDNIKTATNTTSADTTTTTVKEYTLAEGEQLVAYNSTTMQMMKFYLTCQVKDIETGKVYDLKNICDDEIVEGGTNTPVEEETTAPWNVYHAKLHSTQTASGTIDFSTVVKADFTNENSTFVVNPNTNFNRVNLLEQEDGRFVLGVGKDTDGWNAEENYPTDALYGTHGAIAVSFAAPHKGTYELTWKLELKENINGVPNRTYIGVLDKNTNMVNFTDNIKTVKDTTDTVKEYTLAADEELVMYSSSTVDKIKYYLTCQVKDVATGKVYDLKNICDDEIVEYVPVEETIKPWSLYYAKKASLQTLFGELDCTELVEADYTNTNSLFLVNPNTTLNQLIFRENSDSTLTMKLTKDINGYNPNGIYSENGVPAQEGTHGALAIGFTAPHAGDYTVEMKIVHSFANATTAQSTNLARSYIAVLDKETNVMNYNTMTNLTGGNSTVENTALFTLAEGDELVNYLTSTDDGFERQFTIFYTVTDESNGRVYNLSNIGEIEYPDPTVENYVYKQNGTEITSALALTEGATLTVSAEYLNQKEPQSLLFAIVLYDGDGRMVKVGFGDAVTSFKGVPEELSASLVVPKVTSGMAVKALLIDGLSTMVPLSLPDEL